MTKGERMRRASRQAASARPRGGGRGRGQGEGEQSQLQPILAAPLDERNQEVNFTHLGALAATRCLLESSDESGETLAEVCKREGRARVAVEEHQEPRVVACSPPGES